MPFVTIPRDEMVAHITAVEKRCRGPLTPEAAARRDALLAEDRRDDAAAVDAAGRTPCGADFNAIILAGPFDGQQHAYACPRCGVEGVYTAPSDQAWVEPTE